ncbi:hypothetical protein ONZ45_g7725 [Pleurotus djamor]|nr:hypothetical protein ONZ45_g7725 [Pleurotus djamor]
MVNIMTMFSQTPSQDTRSVIQIIWSCLFIIFTCTWTAIHPNVPPARVSSSKWRKLWWRIKIMLWTLMLPETMVSWATYQWKQVREISAKAPTQPTTQPNPAGRMVGAHDLPSDMERSLIVDEFLPHTESSDPVEWTRTHSYFLLMGGFAVPDTEAKDSWKPIQRGDILQTKKPQWSWDIQKSCPWPRIKEADILNVAKGEGLAKTIIFLQVIWFITQLCGRVIQGLAVTELEIMTLAYALICAILYILWFGKPYDVQRPIFLDESFYHPSPPSDNTFHRRHFLEGSWLWLLHGRIAGDYEFSKNFLQVGADEVNAQNLALLISATVFGWIHLFAMTLHFPTQLEFMMWRIASLCVALIPIAFFFLLALLITLGTFLKDKVGILGALKKVPTYLIAILIAILHNAYLISRITLFVQSFVLLRALPPSATQTVSWASFFPHI